jgi:hypothetical protein
MPRSSVQSSGIRLALHTIRIGTALHYQHMACVGMVSECREV